MLIHIFMYSYDQRGWTPLYAAADKGHEGAVKQLIAGGANVNQADKVRYNHVLFICLAKENNECFNF